jgi:CBS domain containing-hemolysin-like protein
VEPDGSWDLSAALRPDEAAEHLGAAVPEHEDYETLAGLVTLHLGRLAEVGDRVTVAAAPAPGAPEATITFEVTALDVHRITAVHARVHRPGDGTAPEDGAEDRAVEVPAHQKESAR